MAWGAVSRCVRECEGMTGSRQLVCNPRQSECDLCAMSFIVDCFSVLYAVMLFVVVIVSAFCFISFAATFC